MQYLKLERVSKSYGEKILFKDLDFDISKGDKIALIAKNGSGKSTLLRIIGGEEAPEGERSRVILNKQIKVGYVKQDPVFHPEATVLETVLDSDNDKIQAIKAYEEALIFGEDERIQKWLTRIDDLKAWDIEVRIKEVLGKFNIHDLSRKMNTLSGGQQKRIALAKMIIDEPDFLIMDEPTNHLDIDMIEWLEIFLQKSKLTLLMVTHDRYFLERVCNQIIELDKGIIFPYKGNYSDYLEKKANRTQVDNTVLDKSKKLLLKELEWMRRQPKARGTKAKSRITEYHKIKDKVSSITYDEAFTIEVDSTRLGKKILELNDMSMAYDDKVILKNFWYKFKKGDRIGVAGPNGAGKTTLIKILTGAVKADTGKRIEGSTVVFGHFSQDGLDMSKEHRVIDHIRQYADYIPLKKGLKLSAERLLETFMFPRPQQLVYISQLSGGEKKRLHLLTVLIQNPNFLILDEPTNDLDILTLNVLESYLRQFPGCLVIVSHDRFFMDKLVDHMFIFEGDGGVKDYNGTYSEWKEGKYLKSDNRTSHPPKVATTKIVKTEADASRKLNYFEKKEFSCLEGEIEKLEKKKKEIEIKFLDATLSPDKIQNLSITLGEIRNEIEEKEMRWLELSELA
ncbi:MAG: ABC-F family ATP-binding cassette domain-containing protein [Saprospiraceae bacterium]